MVNFPAKSGQKNRARGEIQLPKSNKINKSKRNPKGASILEKNRCPHAGYSPEFFQLRDISIGKKLVPNTLGSKQNLTELLQLFKKIEAERK